MPISNRENWVANKLSTDPKVIAALLDENGAVNFNKILPLPCKHGIDWEYISCDAEEAAVAIRRAMASGDNDVALADLIAQHTTKLSERCVEQMHSMLLNYAECGYFHDMEFARKVWGTKWNSVNSRASVLRGTAQFYTVMNYPEGVLLALSRKFPNSEIILEFAEKHTGHNCGNRIFKGGFLAESINNNVDYSLVG